MSGLKPVQTFDELAALYLDGGPRIKRPDRSILETIMDPGMQQVAGSMTGELTRAVERHAHNAQQRSAMVVAATQAVRGVDRVLLHLCTLGRGVVDLAGPYACKPCCN